MEVPVVSFVINRLGVLLIEEGVFIHGVSDKVEKIRVELTRMQCFLEDADTIRDGDARFNNWAVEVKELAYEAEYIIETFVMKVAVRRKGSLGSSIKRFACLTNKWLAHHRVGKQIETIRGKITDLTASLQTYGTTFSVIGESTQSTYRRQLQWRKTYSHVIGEEFIKSEDELNMVVRHLVEDDPRRLVSICGMGGLGKTTLAIKVYHHKDIQNHFECLAWACISQEFQIRDILQGILIKLVPDKKEEAAMLRDEELFKIIYDVQQSKRCLIVLDDIWSMDAWDSLRAAFPDRMSASRILITTRNKELASHIEPLHFLLEPRCLNEEESWNLLRRKAFSTEADTDSRPGTDMEELGKKMVLRYGGLPLAVIVLGGLLATKHTLREWEMISQNIQSRGRRKPQGQYDPVSEVLALSYHDLPYRLKPCFLYFSNYPEDSEICAHKLYQLWMAEGILSTEDKEEEETLMDVAEHYLSALAQRCLVQVKLSASTGRIRYCRIHDLMLELCQSKSKEQNFLKIIRLQRGNDVIGSISNSTTKIHRLAIHFSRDVERAILPDWRTTQQLRSILFFTPKDYKPYKNYSIQLDFKFKNFMLLRVLDLGAFILRKNTLEAVGKLISLRYLSFNSSSIIKLPSSIFKLGFLQTLDLRAMFESNQEINFIKMERLKHLYIRHTNDFRDKFRLLGLSNLETLEYFHTGACYISDLCKLLNLRKLKASFVENDHQDLAAFINYLCTDGVHLQQTSLNLFCDFSSAGRALLLRKLLGCKHLYKCQLHGVIQDFPEYECLSPNITKLHLSECLLKEDPMATLERLPNLLRLSLSTNSFVGRKMVCSANGFPRLRILSFYKLNSLQEWTVEQGAMAKLSILHIAYCNLQMVPDGLATITTLQQFLVEGASSILYDRLQEEGGPDFHKVQHVPSRHIS